MKKLMHKTLLSDEEDDEHMKITLGKSTWINILSLKKNPKNKIRVSLTINDLTFANNISISYD